MSGLGWIHIIWLVVTLGVMLSAYRSFRMEGKRTLFYILVWAALFLVAYGVVTLVMGDGGQQQLFAPAPDPDAPFT